MDEFNYKHLGDAIYLLRTKLNISQKGLAEGICSQSQISKIESGLISPYVHTLVKIAKRLGVDPNYFINHIIKEHYEFITYSKKIIRDEVKKKNYKEVKILIRKLENHPAFNDIEEQQFLQWHKGITMFYLTGDVIQTHLILNAALNMKNSFQFTEQDIQIMNSIAITYCEIDQWDKAKDTFVHAKERYLKSLMINDFTILIRIHYNLSKALYNLKGYKEALNEAEAGIQTCLEFESNYLLGELLYQKGLILLKRNRNIEARASLNESLSIFSLLNKVKYIEIIKETILELNCLENEEKYEPN